MLALTHKQIARKVHEAISSEFNIEIDMDSLQKGSLAPDNYPKKFFMGHSIDVSFDFVKKRINDLCRSDFPTNKKDMERFSYKLGIILHFISDYFCQAHNDKEFKNIIKHYVYEKNLKRYVTRRINTFKPVLESKKSGWNKKVGVVDCVCKKLKEYNLLRRSMTNDLIYSVSVSMIVALKITSICMENSEFKAA